MSELRIFRQQCVRIACRPFCAADHCRKQLSDRQVLRDLKAARPLPEQLLFSCSG